ncbi:uncharacterized protein LAESUDRAFT_764155 [Laetiporus sulphureus 93-53]|uniref:Peptidase C14 caspase domain-containing protein n=1 Tax=Laetiporus sulphureus 93-53 TaxID=1314785 RepID=A0A165BFC3_9APHY|nr:uncharacterized protein LAESUDRAFT_764155 [Laetiporus sulphureus 93-53]KZT00935.1 hypothetical protein LAESUDRAFT_764155 [Laetiporus sulphureus 93-53]
MHYLDLSAAADLREDPKNDKPTEIQGYLQLSSELNHKKKEKDEIMCYLSAMFPLPKPTTTSIVAPPRLKTASLNSSAPVDPVWAVVIGTNKYAHAQWLDGAVKDACAVREFLLHFLHVPEDHISLLLDRNATREAIITTLHDHLLNNPMIKRGDAIIIYFAGHGARYVNDRGGSYEAIVPADRGKMLSADSLDIVEDICEHKLHSYLNQLRDAKGYNITLILDCCYSGGCSRGGPAATRAVRSAAPLHHPPPRLDQRTAQCERKRCVRCLTGDNDWERDMTSHVLLAACQEDELAMDSVRGGAFTRALLRRLRLICSTTCLTTMTYVRLMAKLVSLGERQHPMVVGEHQDSVLFRVCDRSR